MIIAISGNIASGKTTLAKKICSLFDYEYVPSSREELSFLDDFYTDVSRFFLSAQSSFLISKANEIHELVSKQKDIVIDRSIHEDIAIFAKYWMDRYRIDEREKSLYLHIAKYVLSTIPEPDIYVFCKCSPNVSMKRIFSRPSRSFEAKFPPFFIQELYDSYSSFQFPSANVIQCDSERYCFLDDSTVVRIMERIQEQIKKAKTE